MVYYEVFEEVEDVIASEKRIKMAKRVEDECDFGGESEVERFVCGITLMPELLDPASRYAVRDDALYICWIRE